MNVLLLSSRFPWPPFTGDRLRATVWLSALQSSANVALVAPAGRVPAEATHVRLYSAAPSAASAARAALRLAGGLPAHALLAAPWDWAGAIARAREDFGHFDATIVLLSRLDPWVRHLLPDGMTVLDAIDSARRGMVERTNEASLLTRWFWRAESRRSARLEEDAARAYDRVLVVSGEEAGELGAAIVSNGVTIAPLGAEARRFDFGFWGRLAYFANADAVRWLLGEIWPAIRARKPDATLVIGGADAPADVLAWNGRDGVTVISPVESIAALARTIRVAILPVRHGSGQSSKVLEAAEAGCAIVATTKSMRALDALAKDTLIADEAGAVAQLAVAAVSDEPRRLEMAAALRATVVADYARTETHAQLRAVVGVRGAAA